MRRRDLLRSAFSFPIAASLPAQQSMASPSTGRGAWSAHLNRVARPVLENLAAGKLRATMPIEAHATMAESRPRTTHLEALGRLLSGIALWLELSSAPEAFHAQYVAWTQAGLDAALDPASPDRLSFSAENQNLVDAAFLALAVLRAPHTLNAALPKVTRNRLADALRATRVLQAPFNNWLLFAATVEAGLAALGEAWDAMRVDYAIREHQSWYVGDGAYGDGPRFHWDFYNSFVIHPFLLAVLAQVGDHRAEWKAFRLIAQERSTRYAHVQERLIAPDGSWPVLGRSIAYRCGAFHLLADIAWRNTLPADLPPPQARCALFAAIDRSLSAPGTFTSDGWLQIGLCGHQPSLGEPYISTGSLYLCADAFLPLGLPPDAAFWSAPDVPWSSRKAWSGIDMPADHAIEV